LAISPNILRNLGKSVAYSSVDVATKLAPSTTELLRGVRSGFDTTRDFIRTNTARIRTTNIQYERSAVSRKARTFLEDAWNDIKQGNLALGDLSDQSFDDWESFTGSNSSTISYSDQRISEDTEQPSGQDFGSGKVYMSTDYRTLAGMQQLSTVLGKTQIKTAEYQTQQITNAIFMQMASQNEHFTKMERQLDSINKNLVQLVKFQGESQAATNQAHLTFYDQMTRFIKKYEDREAKMNRRTRSTSSRSRTSRFLGEDFFDMSSYKDMVKSNFESSSLGMLASMMTMMDPAMIGMALGGPGGKIQPQRFALNALLKMALPKTARRSIYRGDSQINTMTKTLLTRLGSYQYRMDRGGADTVLGLLGSIFGIDSNMKRTIRMGDFNRGAMHWNGEAQKALVSVIPKELAEIKAAILKTGPKYYDSGSGRFMTEDEVRKRTKERFQNAVENPFANIFNRMSMNPDDRANQEFWQGMSESVQNSISQIVNDAVRNTEGLTDDLTKQLHTVVDNAIKEMNGSIVDTRRMVMTLANAVNKSRSQTASFMESLQGSDSAFSQIAMSMADEYGKIDFDKFMEYIGGAAVDLRAANDGTYSQTGKRLSEMSREERQKYEASVRLANKGREKFRNLGNHRNPKIAALGRFANRAYDRYTGASGSGYGARVSNAIDYGYGAMYDAAMLGENPFARRGERRPGGPSMADMREQRRSAGIVNQAYQQQTGQHDAVQDMASNMEQVREDIGAGFGKDGYMRRIFDSSAFKKIAEMMKNTSFGQKFMSGLHSAGDFLKKLFVEDYTDEDGKTTKSVLSNLKDMGSGFLKTVFGDAVDSRTGEVSEGAIEENRKSILKSLNDAVRKRAPKILTGGVLGGLLSMATGGSSGLLGSLFLPGGPIGGAIAGMGLSILADTEAFKSMMFGKKNQDGEREGGLISKKAVDGFKKALPTLGLGATAGVILKLLGSGGGTAGTVAGFIPNMLLPGGIVGAAIAGAAGAFALKNEKVQDAIFGKMGDDGLRSGSILSNAYNKFTGKIQSAQGEPKNRKSITAKLGKYLKSAGIGAIAGGTLQHMGLLGSSLSFGGPIGAAIAGAALGIAGTSDKFNEYIYGTEGDDGKRQKDGLLSRFSTMLKLNVVEPAANYFKTTAEEFAWWAKERIEVPFRLAFGPVIDSFRNLGQSMKDTAEGTIKDIGARVGKKIESILSPVGNFFMKYILKPLGNVAGGLLKGGLFGAASLVGAPLELASMLLSPTRRKGEKRFGNFLKGNKESNLEKRWAQMDADGESYNKFADRLMYNMGTLPVIGSLFRNNELMSDMAEIYGESDEGRGRNSLDWLGAKADRKRYKKNRKAAHREGKQERKLSNLRKQWGKADAYVSDKVLSEDEFKRRTKMLRKMGIEIGTQEELRQFTYNYSDWKNPKPDEGSDSKIGDDVSGIHNLTGQILDKLGVVAGSVKAMLDIQTGHRFDTESKHPEDIAEDITDDVAEDIQNDQAKRAAAAAASIEAAKEKKKKRQAEHETVTGNTSGAAKDDEASKIIQDALGQNADDSQRLNDDEESSSNNGFINSLLGGGLAKLLTGSGVITAALVAGLAAVLSNPELRKMLGDLLGNVIKKAPEAVDNIIDTVTGENGGLNDQRVVETDPETGEPTKTVKNNSIIARGMDYLRNTKLGQLGVKGAWQLGVKGVNSLNNKLLDIATRPTNIDDAAKAAANTVGKTSDNLFKKALNFIKTKLDDVCKTKLPKGAKAAISKVGTWFDDLVKKIPWEKLAKYSDNLAGALTKCGVKVGSNVIPGAVIVNGVIAGLSAIDGAVTPEKLFVINPAYVDGTMRTISAIIEAVMNFTGVGALIGLISEIVAEFTGFDFLQQICTLIYIAVSDDDKDAKITKAIEEFKQETDNYNKANNTNLSVQAYNDLRNKGIVGKTGNALGNAVDWAANGASKLSIFGWKPLSGLADVDLGDNTNYDQYRPESNSTSGKFGPGPVGYGPLQSDPRWGNQVIGKFPNGRKSTMATGGCGPTALSYAANALGLGVDPSYAGAFASANGYISDGGANDAFFDQGANKLGLSTRRVKGTDIASSLRSGKPVILAGKTSGYGNDPYTKAGHIVTAMGVDGNGNVMVQDPMRGAGTYKMSDLQKSMTSAWAVGRGGATGYGLISDLFGGALNTLASGAAATAFGKFMGIDDYQSAKDAYGVASNATDAVETGSSGGSSSYTYTPVNLEGNTYLEKIWNYLISKGYTKEAASGIMGCWNEESNNRPDRVEGDYLKGFPGFNTVLASNQALDDYTTGKLFPAYARSNISINKSAYKGSDGHYYPGIGLAQWTGPRGYNLFKFAQDNGLDWRNLETQLAFFDKEIAQRGSKNLFNTATSAANGAHIVLDNYEMYKGYGASAPTALQKRQSAANQIYNKFAGGATGYGLMDNLFGGLLGGYKDAIYNKLGITSENNVPYGETGTTGGYNFNTGSVDSGYIPNVEVSKDQNGLVSKMRSILGKLRYSLEWNEQNPDKGVASCASTVGWAYDKVLGVKNMSASSTTQAKDDRFATIWVNNGGNKLDFSKLQPGDVVYQNWDRTSNNGTMKHTEMYAGNEQTLSHGGNPAMGPAFKQMNDYRQKHTMMVRRYKGFMENPTGYGNASFGINTVGQYSHDPDLRTAGFGPGSDMTTVISNRGVETRLDTIIGLMRTIVSSASKTPPATTNMTVNYGPGGDTQVVKPTVIVNQKETRNLGERDASNEYLRTQYRRIASAEHA